MAVVRPQVWVVDDTGFPKDGTSSPGVARQYSGTLGKVGNCRIGVSVHAASDTASCPLSWRLFLPGGWDGALAAGRRARCRIPEGEHHRPKWQLALDMLGEPAAVGLRPAVLVADTGYGANADFRHGLEDRGLAYALQVKGEMTAHAESAVPLQPPYGGLGPRPLPRYAPTRSACAHTSWPKDATARSRSPGARARKSPCPPVSCSCVSAWPAVARSPPRTVSFHCGG
ncbi:SRSO17 transposase [Streptomyces sp. TE33382]